MRSVSRSTRLRPWRSGFSLVELSVVVIIIGVMAAFGVPHLIRSVEQDKAAEAFKYLTSIRDAQERNAIRNGGYASALSELDISHAPPAYFSVGPILPGGTGSIENSWELTLRRQGPSGGYGAYDVTFTQRGYEPSLSSIEAQPDIHPLGP